MTIAADDTTGSISTRIFGDVADEVDESFAIELTNPVGAVLSGGVPVLQSAVVIEDDDGLGSNLALTVASPVVNEGLRGTATANIEAPSSSHATAR